MEKYNCLIVEDEPLAAEVLQDYITQVSFLELKGTCSDGLYALDFLKSGDIDVLFLDIHLPKLKGLDFLRTLKSPPQVIITTAFREYALDGYELNVVDYLLKPISFNRFLGAVNKLRDRSPSSKATTATPGPGMQKYILINVNKKKIKVYIDEILFIESKKEYINIVTTTESHIAKYKLADMETQLDKQAFIRVHRSFIVAKSKIKAYTAIDVEVNGTKIPIGRSYKELVQGLLEQAE